MTAVSLPLPDIVSTPGSTANPPGGAWNYRGGGSGAPRQFTGRILGIAAHATLGGAFFTINGGDQVPIPANCQIEVRPFGELRSPAILFTGTDSYFVEFVT